MKILNISLDSSVLDKNSKTANRVRDYGFLAERYTVVTPAKNDNALSLSANAEVYGVGGINKIIRLYRVYNFADKLLSSENYDVVTSQDTYFLGLVSLILAKKHKAGLEVQAHGWEKLWGLRKMVAKYVVKHADAVRAVSRRLKRRLIDEFGVKEDKITIAPIFSEIGNWKLEIGNLDKKSDKFIFLTVGRLTPIKNIEMQIEAMAEVAGRYPDVELWIAGAGEEIGNLKLAIGNLGLENKIKLLGWRDDLEKFYKQADGFLLTSNYEGWGLAVIEAASYGLPIIMTDVGCAGEVVKNEESGIVIPVGDRRKLEEAMVKLIKDESLRRRLGSGAQEAVLALPSKKNILELYKKSWGKAILDNSPL